MWRRWLCSKFTTIAPKMYYVYVANSLQSRIIGRTRLKGWGSLELALETKRKKVWQKSCKYYFLTSLLWHVQLFCMHVVGSNRQEICGRLWLCKLENIQGYSLRFPSFAMYYIYGVSRPSLLIESTDSMIPTTPLSTQVERTTSTHKLQSVKNLRLLGYCLQVKVWYHPKPFTSSSIDNNKKP